MTPRGINSNLILSFDQQAAGLLFYIALLIFFTLTLFVLLSFIGRLSHVASIFSIQSTTFQTLFYHCSGFPAKGYLSLYFCPFYNLIAVKKDEEGKKTTAGWCFEPSQSQRMTSGLETNANLSPS